MDYVALVKFCLSDVCFSCLSSNRKMYYSERINNCFKTIADIDIPEGVMVKVCWECMAYINNVLRFKGTVKRSYQTLTDYFMKNKAFDAFDRLEDIVACGQHRLQLRSCEAVDLPPQQDWSMNIDIKVEQDVCSDLDFDYAPFDKSTIKEVPEEIASEGDLESNEPTFKEHEVPLMSAENSLKEATLLTSVKHSQKRAAKRSTNTDKHYQCDHCGKEFRYRYKLYNHMGIHTDKKRFKCELCSFKTNYYGSLKMHMRTHTGEKPFSCNLCSYKCKAKAVLDDHIRTHTGNYSLSCKLCPYKCIHRKSLQIHMYNHTGEKPFSCELCPYKSVMKGNLNKHMLTHTGEKPFICEFCSAGYSKNHYLQNHLRTHTGEKPFSCEICLLRFRTKNNLRGHMKTHIDEKPFGCELCSYRSRRRYGLKEHMRTHASPKGIKRTLN